MEVTVVAADAREQHVHATLDGFANKHAEAFDGWLRANRERALAALNLVAVAGWCTEHVCPTIPHDWSEPGDREFGEECWLAVWNTDVRGCCSSQLGKARIYLDESEA